MKLSLPSLKKIALIAVGLIVVSLLLLWLALPRIVQSQAEKFVIEKTGHQLVMDRPEFNPFQLALRLGKLQLNDPDGKPLFGFDGLLVDISGASIVSRALVFDAIRLDGPAATLIELPEGKLNWTPFLAALESKEEQPNKEEGLPRVVIRSFVLASGKLDFADRRGVGAGFDTRIEPLDLELRDLSTLPDDAGKFKIEARTSIGAQVAIEGEVDLNPLAVAGTFSLQGLRLDQLAPFVKDVLPGPPAGTFGASARYRAGNSGTALTATVDQIEAEIGGLHLPLGKGEGAGVSVGNIALKGGSFDLSQQLLTIGTLDLAKMRLELPRIDRSLDMTSIILEEARIDLAGRQVNLASLALVDGNLYSVRSGDGRIYLFDALKALADTPQQPAAQARSDEAQAAPWRFKLGKFSIANLNSYNRDEGVTPPAELDLEKISVEVRDITENPTAPLPVKLAFDVGSGGRFEAEGKYTLAGPVADFKIRLADLSLQPIQPYLAEKTTLVLADGRLSTQGRAIYNEKGPNVKGEFTVNDLRLMESGEKSPLLAWKSFGSRDLVLTQKSLDFGELRLGGLNTRLHIDKDKNINFKRVLRPSAGAKPAEPVPAVTVQAPSLPPAPTFIVNIDRLRFHKGLVDFADESLILPFGTRIHELKGSIAGLSNRPDAVGQIELDGAVDAYGMARAVGHVELGNPTNSLDMRVQFRNVEMTSLTPYTAQFAGRKIDSGKLTLDLQYKIVKRQLQGENQVVMDKLTLGERVEHPDASNLPLDLAIALLQDSDGRIDLGLPVSGSLDDPQFSYGSLIWKAITNVLTKIVTAPFRALGALLGGGGEKVENIVFEAGAAQLTPPEREKVAKLAEAMGKRPGLALSVGGVHVEADRVALQDVQLRRTVLTQAGQRVPERGDPGPISTQQPKIRETLETLYKDRVGTTDLAALKEGFRSANPGQLEESMTGKVMSRLSGLMREKKTLSEGEVAQLKGADFYGMLFERLRAKEGITDERLQDLAQKRGEGVAEIIKSAGVAPERVQLMAPEKGKSEGEQPTHEIPLRLSLEPAKTK